MRADFGVGALVFMGRAYFAHNPKTEAALGRGFQAPRIAGVEGTGS